MDSKEYKGILNDYKDFMGFWGILRDFNLTQLCTNFVLVVTQSNVSWNGWDSHIARHGKSERIAGG